MDKIVFSHITTGQWLAKVWIIRDLAWTNVHASYQILPWPNSYRGVWYGGIFFYNWECENILKFGRRFEPIFPRLLHSQKGKSTKKYSHSPHRNPTFLWEENVCHNKKIKISLLPSKATRCWSLSTAAGRHPPSATGRPPVATSIKVIFGNLPNIPKNLICIPNTPKISYPIKLFP